MSRFMLRTLALATSLVALPVHAQVVPAPAQPPMGEAPQDDAHAGARRAMGEGPPIAEARASSDVPAGTVRVRVLRPNGNPIQGATVRLGVMVSASGGRQSLRQVTNAEGIAIFSGLATGQAQAYRPSVVSQRATYGTTPFQLEPDRGHEASIRVFPVTDDIASLLLVRGQAIIELRPERMHVTMQLDVANITEETYVFPENGLAIALPEGATAFQAQASMSDQRLAAEDGVLKMRGSIPPGRAAFVYGYDLPYDGDTLDITLPNPFRTMSFGVAIESTTGLTLEVDDFAPSEAVDVEGRNFRITNLQRAPTDPPLDAIHIVVTGIPGKGPYGPIALVLALGVFAIGAFASRGKTTAQTALAKAREARKAELVAEGARLRAEREAGEIGPEFYAKSREALIAELAAVLAAQANDAKR